jgi:DNA helicase TIP49 (TBP-interacting protein)
MIADARDWIHLIRGGRGIGKTHAALTVAQALGRDCAGFELDEVDAAKLSILLDHFLRHQHPRHYKVT